MPISSSPGRGGPCCQHFFFIFILEISYKVTTVLPRVYNGLIAGNKYYKQNESKIYLFL